MKWVTRALVALFVLALLAGAGVAGGYIWLQGQLDAPYAVSENRPETIMIPRGAGAIHIGGALEEAGLIPDARLFRIGVELKNAGGELKAGEYAIPAEASINEIIDLLIEGDVILHNVQIIEGSTIAQAMRAIEASEVLTGDMLAPPEEGAFLPNTYSFVRGTSRAEVVETLMRAQDELMDEIWPARQPDLPIRSREEAIILASIVEKETGGLKDEDLVASAFINRLKRGIRLQSDPTIIYGISKGERLTRTINGREVQRGLFQSEIDRVTPYNTYQIDGLPPTPICNPSEAALRAVLQPADTDYLFFVADGTGGHAFSKTYAEHRRNVQKWREIEAEMRRAQREAAQQ